MTISRPTLTWILAGALAAAACSRRLPDAGPLVAASDTVEVSGQYQPVSIDSVERLSIDDQGRLLLHGASSTATVDLPPAANALEKNRGWALVTEGEDEQEGARSLTFTQETTLEDFTIKVPDAEGQVAYGSLGARDGGDVVVFAYGSAPRAYWGWALVHTKSHP